MLSLVKNWEADFAEYVRARGPALRNLAYLICGDWHRADDHAQGALVSLYVAWRRIDHQDNLDAYARRTLVNTVLNERRRPWRRERTVTAFPDPPVPAQAERVAQSLALRDALRALPPRQRAAVVLRYWEDMSVADTAALLGVAEGTIKASCARGLAALRNALSEAGIEEAR